jgi:co-chaperonin GroES (HSP10)
MELYNHSNNHPLNNKICVFIDSVIAPKSNGGILMPEEVRSGQAYAATSGIVLELGGSSFKEMSDAVKVGDRVTFRSYSGIHVKEFHEESQCDLFYRLLEDKEVHAIYSKTKKFLKSKK